MTLMIHPTDDSLAELLEAMIDAGVEDSSTASKILRIHGYEVTENNLHDALHQIADKYQ